MRTVVCLKWGNKYSPQYVNVLYNMVTRHSTIDRFICLTENPKNLNPNIEVIPLPDMPLHGWWFKLYAFSKDLKLKGDVLFLDLDLVILQNIEQLWNYEPEHFTIIRDFNRKTHHDWCKFNSSAFRFDAKTYHWIWDEFQKNYNAIVSRNHGDQDHLYSILQKQAKTWPDEWIQSYKWEIRNKDELGIINGKRNFTSIKNPKIDHRCLIAVFHGDPKPDQTNDPIILENWK